MPVSPKTKAANSAVNLRITVTQARVLRALAPANLSDCQMDWPLLTRARLFTSTGLSPASGALTRVLNGIRPGNTTSGKPHPGILARGLIEEVALDIDGIKEVNYRITAVGVAAYQSYIVTHGKELPPLKDAALCVNNRYLDSSSVVKESQYAGI